MSYVDWSYSHDRWKTNQPFEPVEIEIAINDIRQIPEEYLILNEQKIIDDYKSGQRDFPGLDVCEIF